MGFWAFWGLLFGCYLGTDLGVEMVAFGMGFWVILRHDFDGVLEVIWGGCR